jgi:hypothetical protein
MVSAIASAGRASAKAEAIAAPFKKYLRDAFERESKVGLFMTGKRFIEVSHYLSRQVNIPATEKRGSRKAPPLVEGKLRVELEVQSECELPETALVVINAAHVVRTEAAFQSIDDDWGTRPKVTRVKI